MERKNSMRNLGLKFRYLWMPFLWLTVLSAFAATLVHGAVVHLGWPPLDEQWTLFYLPMALPGIPLYLWLYPKLKRGVVAAPGKDAGFGLLVFAWLSTMTFVLVTQNWFARASEHLDHASTVDDLHAVPDLSCVELAEYEVPLHQGQWNQHVHVTGKRAQTLKYDLFFVVPIGKDEADTVGIPAAWLVRTFHESLPSSSSEAEKEKAWSALVASARAQLDSGILSHTSYLRNEKRSEYRSYFLEAITSSHRSDPDGPVLLLSAHHEPFDRSSGKMVLYAVLAFLGGGLLWFIVLLFLRIDRESIDHRVSVVGEAGSAWSRFVDVAVPRRGLFITRILVWVNVLVFLALVVAGAGFMSLRTSLLVEWGANNGPLVLQGGYERLLVSTFLHGSIIHLVMNMGGLVLAGFILEPVLGRWTSLLVYLICGVAASIASIWWEPDHISVGASGAIFGLYGIVLALGFFSRRKLPDMTGYGVVSAMVALGRVVGGLLSPVTDNAAHLGGLVGGFVLGIVLSILGRFRPDAMDAG